MTCPSCGAPAPEGARFCPSCGHQLAALGEERRVVTVLFADLVGFTGLSEGRDPESVKRLVDRCFEDLVGDIKSFGGQVDKIVGDAIVALFGAPVAHEDDPERAVRAALRMQQTLSDSAADLDASIRMRIGVNTGEVLVGALRAGGDYTAMGDVVNTASRLQSMAQPGEVLVGPATYAATRDVIGYQPVGLVEVRGREDRVEAWRAVTALAPPGYRRRRTRAPLIGRDTELAMIGHTIDNAVDRRRASVVTLLGEAGVGKNRLAREVAALAAQRHHTLVLEGRCVPYGEANVWWPIAEAVRHFFDVAADLAPDLLREEVTPKVAEAFGAPADDPGVTRVVHGLMHLLGTENPLRDIDSQRAREEMLRSVSTFFEALLTHRPLMLVLSDLHWAGQPVFDLLGALLERLSDTPFLVVVTARPPFRESWLPGGAPHNSLVVNLEPLRREAAAALLDALLDGRVDRELRQALLDRSGGNPFFLEELVALVDDGAGLDTFTHRAIGATTLPDTLRGLVAARLDSLTLNERRALDDAAVYGRQGPIDALVLMAAADRAGQGVRSEAQVRAAVQGLVDKEVLVLDESGRNYQFRSDLVREVAYNTLTKAARALRHWGIAQYLDLNFARYGEVNTSIVDGLAHHYGQAAELVRDLGGVAGIPSDVTEQALHWLIKAAERAEAADSHPAAERLYSKALSLVATRPSPRRIQLLLGRARARAGMRRLPAARTDLSAALEAAEALDDHECRARALLIRGTIEEREGARAEAIATFTEAAAAFAELGDRSGTAESLRLRGMAEMFGGEADAAHESISRALEAFTELDDRHGQAWALQNLAWLAFLEGRPAEADRRIEQSAAMFEEIGDTGGLGWALGLRAWVRFHQGHWDEAEQLCERILVESRERGDRWASGMMLVLSAQIRLWTGRAELAIPRAQEAREVFDAVGDLEREVQSAAVLGRALIATGTVGEGFRTLDLAVESSRGASEGPLALGATAVASAAAAIGDPERALRAVALVGLDDLDPAVIGESDRLVATGLALLQMDQLDEARSHLEAAVVLDSEEEASTYALSGLACVRAVEGRVDECRSLTAQVLGVERSTYLDRVTALCALGSLLRGRGERAEAEQLFDRATAIADATDDRVAQALVRLARSEAARSAGEVLPDLSNDAHRRLTDLGIDALGWLRVFRGAAMAGAGPPATPRPA
jgi:class 3 adenylate cyclase/tetratricopeptide (TPR) repeat protein